MPSMMGTKYIRQRFTYGLVTVLQYSTLLHLCTFALGLLFAISSTLTILISG